MKIGSTIILLILVLLFYLSNHKNKINRWWIYVNTFFVQSIDINPKQTAAYQETVRKIDELRVKQAALNARNTEYEAALANQESLKMS